MSEVTVFVTDQNGNAQPGVSVNFNISSVNAIGHGHSFDTPPWMILTDLSVAQSFTHRNEVQLSLLTFGPPSQTCTTGPDGTCTVFFEAYVSGIYTMLASLRDPQNVSTSVQINVKVDNLLLLNSDDTTDWVNVGEYLKFETIKGLNIKCSGGSVISKHGSTHFGNTNLISDIRAIARRFKSETNKRINLNDMGLEFGGLLDIYNNGRPRHESHNRGINADIDFNFAASAGTQLSDCDPLNAAEQDILDHVIMVITGNWPFMEPGHFHITSRP